MKKKVQKPKKSPKEKKTKTTKKVETKVNNRHKGLIISTVIALPITLTALGLGFESVNMVEKNNRMLHAVGMLRTNAQAVSLDVLDIRVGYAVGHDRFLELKQHVKTTLKELQAVVDALYDGKTIMIKGKNVDVPVVTDKESRQALEIIAQEWYAFNTNLTDYFERVDRRNKVLTELNAAVKHASNLNLPFHTNLNLLVEKIEQRNLVETDRLRQYFLVALIVAGLYLLTFLFIFLPRLRSLNTKAQAGVGLEMKEIMATVNEGLFLIDEDLNISEHYSACLEKLLGQKYIAGRRLDDLLKPIVSQKDLATTRDFVEQLFNPRVKENLIHDLNPVNRLPVQISDGSGAFQSYYLSFSFSRVHENNEIKRILVGVSDITQEVLLEQKLNQKDEQNSQQIQLLTSIMHADPYMLYTFLSHAYNSTERINDILKRSENEETDLMIKTKDIFREVHSLKGEASALELEEFVSLTHSFEERIVDLQNKPNLNGNDFLPLTVSLDQVIEQLNRVDALIKHIGSLTTIANHDESVVVGGNAKEYSQAKVVSHINTANGDALTSYFSKYVNNVSHRNHKSVELQTTGLNLLVRDTKLSDNLTDVIVQLIRNAVVHGIETPEKRLQMGKNETGTVKVIYRVSEKNNMIELIVADDGVGIQFSEIRKKLVTIGLCDVPTAKSLSKKQLVALLFDSGFSTITQVSEDAGRGVGMDVIKERVENKLGGKIQIDTRSGYHTRFLIQLPLNKVRGVA